MERTGSEPVLVRWTSILRGYAHLRDKDEADNRSGGRPFGSNGQFVMPLLAKLTTVKFVPNKVPRTLRYLPEGRPPKLRSPIEAKHKRRLTVIIERDKGGYYVASVPELQGCHTQGKSLDEVMQRIQEAALRCLKAEGNGDGSRLEFVGVQIIEV